MIKSKNQIAIERYGYGYDKCCWQQKKRIDGMFHAEEDKLKTRKE